VVPIRGNRVGTISGNQVVPNPGNRLVPIRGNSALNVRIPHETPRIGHHYLLLSPSQPNSTARIPGAMLPGLRIYPLA